MAKIVLITGGARSGKSSFALEMAEAISPKRVFIATCPQVDVEMSARVRRHQKEREGRGWATIETETGLAALFDNECRDYDVVLLDCITLWVNNVLFSGSAEPPELSDQKIGQLCRQWLAAAELCPGTVICVSNEVGLGIVPDNKLARLYRDLVGTCNQLIAKAASEVILVSCGIPLFLKKSQG